METSTSTIRAAASADAASAESCMNELMLVTGSRPANWCAPRPDGWISSGGGCSS